MWFLLSTSQFKLKITHLLIFTIEWQCVMEKKQILKENNPKPLTTYGICIAKMNTKNELLVLGNNE